MRRRRRSKLARPYIRLFSSLILVTLPSTAPEGVGRGEGGLDGCAVASHAIGQGAEFTLAVEADVGGPDVEGEVFTAASADPATPGRCPSILTTATRTRLPRPPQQQSMGVAPSRSGPHPVGCRPSEGGRPIPRRGHAAEASSDLGAIGLRRPHDVPSPPGRGDWTGEGVVTCAQVPPLTLHPRIERPGRVRRNDRRSRRRSGDPHCASQASGLGQPAARPDHSSGKSAKGQHSSDQS